MRLLAVAVYSKNPPVFDGWVQNGKEYIKFFVTPKEVEVTARNPVSDYEDYEHFAGVIGKFDPYLPFFSNPPSLKDLTFEEVEKAYLKAKLLGNE